MRFPTAAGIVIYKARTIRTSVREGLEYTAEEDIFENIRDYPSVMGELRDCRMGESPAMPSQHDMDHPRLDRRSDVLLTPCSEDQLRYERGISDQLEAFGGTPQSVVRHSLDSAD